MRNIFFALFISLYCSYGASSYGQSGYIYTLAGDGTAGFSGDGGLATAAQLNRPTDVFKDGKGNIYIADRGNNRIRLVNQAGIISTFAGTGTAGYTGDGGPATAATFNAPKRMVVDPSGNMYIADQGNNVIRKIDTTGIISTIAGTGVSGVSGDGGPATVAQLDTPTGVAIDLYGNIYISDSGSSRIRKIDPAGIISTFAGGGSVGFSVDGTAATAVALCTMRYVAVDDTGAVYFTNQNCWHFLRITTDGYLYNVAGNESPSYSGDGGPADSADVEGPFGVCPDNNGNIFLSPNGNNRVRRVNKFGYITTVAGTGAHGYTGDGGPAMAATMGSIYGIYSDSRDNVYIVDMSNNVIRSFTTTSYTDTICVGDTVTLNKNIYTGTWSSASPSVATVDSNTGHVSGIAAGTAIITYNNIAPELFLVTVSGFSIHEDVTNITCYSDRNGIISALANGDAGIFKYRWSNGDSVSSTISGLEPGFYTVRITDTVTKCTEADSFYVSQPDSIIVTALIKNDVCRSGDGSIELGVAGGTAPYSYSWADNNSSSLRTGLKPGAYAVTISDSNNCEDKYTAQVGEDTCYPIIVHDVITPNGDGINDVWVIDGITDYPRNTVQVFDKLGNMVYHKSDYGNEWNGEDDKGEKLPDGTYFYLVKLNAENATGGKNVFTGTILIKR